MNLLDFFISTERNILTSSFPRAHRRWVYLYLRERDGPACSICGKNEANINLEIHHIDGNPCNSDPLNLRLLCHSCNIKTEIKRNKNSRSKHHGVIVERGRKKLDATSKIKDKVDYQKGSAEMQANDYFELAFRNWLIAYIIIHKAITKDEAIASGAEITGASINACRNYLLKFKSEAGPGYEIKLASKTRVIRLKKQYLDDNSIDYEGEGNGK